jgi:plastocyanin
VAQDGGPVEDGGILPGGCASDYAGCTSFTNFTADGGTISFSCCSYIPKCVRIRVGQPLRFSGFFGDHPLAQGCGPEPVIVNSPGPYTFAVPGRYGFYCTAHGSEDGSGMAGAVDVIP